MVDESLTDMDFVDVSLSHCPDLSIKLGIAALPDLSDQSMHHLAGLL